MYEDGGDGMGDREYDAVDDLVRKTRWGQLCDRIEGLIREYADVLYDERDFEDWETKPKPPNWDNPLAISDFSLVLCVEDTEPDQIRKGHWVLHVEPLNQLPYRTRGLLEERLDLL